MWYPVLAQQEFLAEKKQTAFPLAESVPMAAPSEPSQVQTVPCWQGLAQTTVVLLVLLSKLAFLLLMFPDHAQTDLSAIDKQSAVFHESANLVAGVDAQVRRHPAHIPAFLVVGSLREKQSSP